MAISFAARGPIALGVTPPAFTPRQVALFTPNGIVEINQTLTVQSAVGFIADLNQKSS